MQSIYFVLGINAARSLIIQSLGHNGHMKTINECRRLFASQIKNGTTMPIDLRQSVYSVVLFNGDSTTYDQLIQVTLYLMLAFIYVAIN